MKLTVFYLLLIAPIIHLELVHLDHHLTLGLNKYIQQHLHLLLVLAFIQDHFVNPAIMYLLFKHVILSFRGHIDQ